MDAFVKAHCSCDRFRTNFNINGESTGCVTGCYTLKPGDHLFAMLFNVIEGIQKSYRHQIMI
jgi:hypothetical protein